jgi:hypothetical protein
VLVLVLALALVLLHLLHSLQFPRTQPTRSSRQARKSNAEV